jgi:hypothetical protein
MSEQPQHAQPGLEAKLAEVRTALYRARLTDAEARTRAYGVYQDWMSDIAGRHTAETLTEYATRKAGR